MQDHKSNEAIEIPLASCWCLETGIYFVLPLIEKVFFFFKFHTVIDTTILFLTLKNNKAVNLVSCFLNLDSSIYVNFIFIHLLWYYWHRKLKDALWYSQRSKGQFLGNLYSYKIENSPSSTVSFLLSGHNNKHSINTGE